MEVFIWYILLALIGITFIPIGEHLFKKLPDKAYPFYRFIGLAFLSFVVWTLGSLHIVAFTRWGVYFAFAIYIFASIYVYVKNGKKKLDKVFIKKLLMYELLYLVLFALLVLYKCYRPDISDIEKFPDLAFLNSISKSLYFPPQDPWYAGHSMNYYYFGQIMAAVLTKLAGIPTAISYNLMIATSYSLYTVGVFSLVYNLTKKYTIATISTVAASVMTNTLYIYSYFKHETMIWWSGIRSIPYAINDYPLYSFLSGDLHAHFMALPLDVFCVLVCYQYFVKNDNRRSILILLGFLFGILFMSNSWDILVYPPLFAALFAYKFISTKDKPKNAIRQLSIVIIASLITLATYMPYYKSVIYGIKPFTGQKSPIIDFLSIYNFQLLIISSYIIYKYYLIIKNKIVKKRIALTYVLLSIIVSVASMPLLGQVAPVALFLLLLLGYVFLKDYKISNKPQLETFIQILIALCLVIIIFCEILIVDDFIDGLNERANTTYKLYYQFWMITSIIAGYTMLYFYKQKNKKTKLIVIILLASLVLNTASFWYRVSESANHFAQYKGLDGSLFLKASAKYDYQAINWINANIKEQSVISEKVGDTFSQDSKISAFTGNAAPLGWYAHAWTWHNNPTELTIVSNDINTLYTSQNPEEIRMIVAKYKIQYIYLGPAEVAKYQNPTNQFNYMYKLIYKNCKSYLYSTAVTN